VGDESDDQGDNCAGCEKSIELARVTVADKRPKCQERYCCPGRETDSQQLGTWPLAPRTSESLGSHTHILGTHGEGAKITFEHDVPDCFPSIDVIRRLHSEPFNE
jgi:hypothetical protein